MKYLFNMLLLEEQKQYARQLILSKIGTGGQLSLKQAKVLVVGAGGLGSAVLQYLGAAGVGEIGIVDNDKVSQSNLHRQVLYSYNQIGEYKSLIAAERLTANNPFIKVKAYQSFLDVSNALELIRPYDLVVDCTDNFASRYLINDATVVLNKPWVYGSINNFTGQVSVFNYKKGATYRCLYPTQPTQSHNDEYLGVIGTIPAWVGAIQANEVIKVVCKIGSILRNKLLVIDALECTQNTYSFQKNNKINVTNILESY